MCRPYLWMACGNLGKTPGMTSRQFLLHIVNARVPIRLKDMLRICEALGYRLTVRPISKPRKSVTP